MAPNEDQGRLRDLDRGVGEENGKEAQRRLLQAEVTDKADCGADGIDQDGRVRRPQGDAGPAGRLWERRELRTSLRSFRVTVPVFWLAIRKKESKGG